MFNRTPNTFRVTAQIRNNTIAQAFEELAATDVKAVLRAAVAEASKAVRHEYSSITPRSNRAGLHLADSLGMRLQTMRDKVGATSTIGVRLEGGKTVVKHFHVQEKGSTLRYRKRIGGKYAWVEDVIAGMPQAYKVEKRRTGAVTGQHYLERAFNNMLEASIQTIRSQFSQRVLRKYVGTRSSALA